MMGKGYSWIVTDGITGAHHLFGQENRMFPDYLDGLIGTMPKSTVGPAFRNFALLYSQNFTRERLLKTGLLQWNPSDLTVSTKIKEPFKSFSFREIVSNKCFSTLFIRDSFPSNCIGTGIFKPPYD
jgi:hypothetical protein